MRVQRDCCSATRDSSGVNQAVSPVMEVRCEVLLVSIGELWQNEVLLF